MTTQTTDQATVTDLRERLARLEAVEERLRLALRAGHIGTYDFDPRTETATWDRELYAIWGLPLDTPDVFAAVQSTIHPDDLALWEADVARSLDPSGTGRHDFEMRITRPDTGELRWLHAQGDAAFEDGVPIRLVGAVRDITSEKRLLEREQLLAREMNHRVQNIFAVVSGMVRMSAGMATSVDGLKNAITGRLRAMASAHSLIEPRIEGDAPQEVDVALHALASSVLAPYMEGADRVTLDGPSVTLGPKEASGLALILHEWGTNAAKHGALSRPDGRLTLGWSWLKAWETNKGVAMDPSGHPVRLRWTESGGPPLQGPPTRTGFGSRLIQMTARPPAFSPVRTDWSGGGVVHELDILGLLSTR